MNKYDYKLPLGEVLSNAEESPLSYAILNHGYLIADLLTAHAELKDLRNQVAELQKIVIENHNLVSKSVKFCTDTEHQCDCAICTESRAQEESK